MSSNRKIAIIGAGPSGLTLGRLLHVANIPFAIFEGEANALARNQGGTLDLHEKTGLLALRKAGLFSEFQKYVRYDGESFVLADKDFKKYVELGGAEGEEDSSGRPEIDRKRLRQILLESVPDEKIHWGRHLKNVGDDLVLTFQDGSTERGFDLIVGADGAWSKIRPLVTDVKPYYTGIAGICSQITHSSARFPDLFRVVNKGSVFTFSDGKGVTIQFNGDDSLQVYCWFLNHENWQKNANKDVKIPIQAKEYLDGVFEDWSSEIKAFFQHADEDDSVVLRNLYMLPVNHRWDHRKGATLIGDSAHLMTPYAGEGVNTAMTDAMVLADAIIKSAQPDELDSNIKAFEEEMFVRAGKVQELTKGNMDDFMSTAPMPVWIPRLANRMAGEAGNEAFEKLPPSETKERIINILKEQ